VKITISKEDYLKTIAEAESEGEPVIAATLARWLRISPPAVTAGLRRLTRDGLIRIGNQGRIVLRKPGRDIAGHLLQRHHLVERMLTEMFGMEWYKVHEEAERLEHAVSEDFERLLISVLGPGKSCPHGNAVSSDTPRDRRARGLLPLDEVFAAGAYIVASVYERDRRLLEFLDHLRLRPGVSFEWRGRNYDDTLSLKVAGRRVLLGVPAARRIWVAEAGKAVNFGFAGPNSRNGGYARG
jgi:DtxR family transcriptional regulator, Mn-dependent transcriptional regulator